MVPEHKTTLVNSFWDTEVSGISVSDGGVGLTSSEMQMRDTFETAGWDFEDVWMICEGEDYPHLQWEGIECEE